MKLTYQYSDGGRLNSSHKHDYNDCTVRALSMAAEIDYDYAYDILKDNGRNYGEGLNWNQWVKDNIDKRFTINELKQNKIQIVKELDLPKGNFIVRISQHVFAVVDNILLDDCYSFGNNEVMDIWEVIPNKEIKHGKLKFKCPICDKPVRIESERPIGKVIMRSLSCGHFTREKLIEVIETEFKMVSIDDKEPFPFQYEGIEFIEKSQFKTLVADEMRLGKTIQSLGAYLKHKDEMSPMLIVCKSALTLQFMYECLRWLKIPAFVITSSKHKLFPNFKIYIVSYDLLRRLPETYFDTVPFKLLILDECQHIKSHTSNRTNQVRKLADKIKYIIALSGTPIKNRPSEYFPILNILRPDMFRDRSSFLNNHVNTYNNGFQIKEEGLRNPKRFFELTKDFIIRRTREQVAPQMPKIMRDYRYIEFEEEFEDAYNETVRKFLKYMEDTGNPYDFKNYSNTLAYIAKMRHICGLAKVEETYNYLDEFLLSTERKITVFLHHLDVATLLKQKLTENKRNYKEISSNQSTEEKMKSIEEFRDNPDIRVLIASTLSAGEGLNLGFCQDFVMMERQWNPANEEQCESRFPDITKSGTILGCYMVAIGTIDEYLSRLVEQKRAMFVQAMEGKNVQWDETSIIKELTEILIKEGRKNFSIKR